MIFGVVHGSIKSLLNPELTASWELGLTPGSGRKNNIRGIYEKAG